MTKRGYTVSNEFIRIVLPLAISTLSSHSGRHIMTVWGVSGGIPLHRAGLGSTDIPGYQSCLGEGVYDKDHKGRILARIWKLIIKSCHDSWVIILARSMKKVRQIGRWDLPRKSPSLRLMQERASSTIAGRGRTGTYDCHWLMQYWWLLPSKLLSCRWKFYMTTR